jgi:6-phosphogluconolactonase
VAHEAADLLSVLAIEAVRDRGRFSVALSGGSTPQALFILLAAPPYSSLLPWHKMHFFWGDERLVPPDDAGSNYYHAAQLLLDKVHVPAENVHRVQGESSAEAAVVDYTAQLKSFATGQRHWPHFDLVLLGMGSDGHTASIFPGSPLKDKSGMAVKAVTADYEDRPSQRLTLTSAVFNDARHILFLVTGANKADAVTAILDGPSDPEQWPAQRIQPSAGSITWHIDQAAAKKLRRKP